MCVPWLAILCVVQRWRTDTGLPFSCELYNVVTGKEPRLWNCQKSSCHGAFLDTTNPLEPSHVKNSPFLGGTRGIVLLSSRVWKDVNDWVLEIGISCTYSNPVITGGRKHTHTHIVSLLRMPVWFTNFWCSSKTLLSYQLDIPYAQLRLNFQVRAAFQSNV